jgi:hypothetical protein
MHPRLVIWSQQVSSRPLAWLGRPLLITVHQSEEPEPHWSAPATIVEQLRNNPSTSSAVEAAEAAESAELAAAMAAARARAAARAVTTDPFVLRMHTRYRFVSHDQRRRWVGTYELKEQDEGVSGVVHQSLSPDQFETEPDCKAWIDGANGGANGGAPHGLSRGEHGEHGYFLWVADLVWGWSLKGLNVFVTLASRRPDLTFVAYASGHDDFIMQRLKKAEEQYPNFSFKGPLARGSEHARVFCAARAFVTPTRNQEAFGRTTIEALARGTPVRRC